MSEYTIEEIKSLDFRTGVRTRIQMYLGSNDLDGAYQALKEIINNSTDEALAGYGKKIDITFDEETNSLSVRDYGRGVPFGIRENGENVLVAIYTNSHTGGKFDHEVYKNASGLNGMGATCVCLSSSKFYVASIRDKIKAYARFEKGILKEYKEVFTTEPNGTYVKFTPDPEVFSNGNINYDFKRICEDTRDISYLYNGITFTVKNDTNKEIHSYCAKNGIVDFIKDSIKSPMHKTIIHKSMSDGVDSVEIAFQWGSAHEQPYVFVNGLRVPELGTPVTGAKTSITRVFNSLAKEKFDGDSIRQNLFYVINCQVKDPSFANQTKTKINNASLRTLSANAFTEALNDMFYKNKTEFEAIAEMLRKVQKAEAAADKARKQVLNATKEIEKNQKRKVFASDKLKDAEFLGKDSILLISEGNSASASLSVARDEKKYGILAIRGKMLNPLSNPEEKIFKNEEIKLLLSAMNIVPGKYNAEKLRYGRIGICSDADRT